MKSILTAVILVFATVLSAQAQFHLVKPGTPSAAVMLLNDESGPVRLAVEDFVNDVRKITGESLEIVRLFEDCPAQCVVVGNVENSASRTLLEMLDPRSVTEVSGKWESYRVRTIDLNFDAGPVEKALVVTGSDERGTMFGLYAFMEEYLEVDPMYFWTGLEPKPREILAWENVEITADQPDFRFRGWFLNDEDLLVEWKSDGGTRHINYPYYGSVTSRSVYEAVYEAMLRLQLNLVIPASFNDVANPDEARAIEMAVKRGLFVSMHHVEPMGVSGFAYQNYWRLRGQGKSYSITKNQDAFEEVWRYYAKLWAQYPNVVWQLGLRGIADSPIWAADPDVPDSDAARGKIISDAIAKQWEIVKEVDRRPNPPATTTLWMEGARLHEQGHLSFPKEVTVIFADNSPGWTWQADFFEVERQPERKYGVYYHHALWGSGPHFVQGVSPRRAYERLQDAFDRESHYYAILNVSNVREFALGVDASARMLRNFSAFDLDAYMQEWTSERFGPVAEQARAAYERFFDSYVTRESRMIDAVHDLPYLLDGQTLHIGEHIFGRLLSSVAVPSSIVSLHQVEELNELLQGVRQQKNGMNAAGEIGEKVKAALEGDEKRFFEANFVAQQTIMVGLLEWLEAGILATLAKHEGNSHGLLMQAGAAKAAFERIRAGQKLATWGRFEDWYRGDRKMNFKRAEETTRQLLAALQKEGQERVSATR